MYTLPELPYDLAALEPHYSAKVLELHHDKHHAAYVKGLNETLEKLDAVRTSGDYSSIVGLQRTLAFNLSGHVLHSIFWENLSPEGGGEPSGELGDAIERDFGSFERFKAHLTQATTTVQGSGWGALAYDGYGERLYIEQVYDHQGNVGRAARRCSCWTPGSTPTTCSTSTSAPTTSTRCGTSSTGTMSPSATSTPNPDTAQTSEQTGTLGLLSTCTRSFTALRWDPHQQTFL